MSPTAWAASGNGARGAELEEIVSQLDEDLIGIGRSSSLYHGRAPVLSAFLSVLQLFERHAPP